MLAPTVVGAVTDPGDDPAVGAVVPTLDGEAIDAVGACDTGAVATELVGGVTDGVGAVVVGVGARHGPVAAYRGWPSFELSVPCTNLHPSTPPAESR